MVSLFQTADLINLIILYNTFINDILQTTQGKKLSRIFPPSDLESLFHIYSISLSLLGFKYNNNNIKKVVIISYKSTANNAILTLHILMKDEVNYELMYAIPFLL